MFESETTETRPDYRLAALSLAVSIMNGPSHSISGFTAANLRDATLIIAKGFLTEQTDD